MKNNKSIVTLALIGALTLFLPAVAYESTLKNATRDDVTFQVDYTALSLACLPFLTSKKIVVKPGETGTVDSGSCCASTMNVWVGDEKISKPLAGVECAGHELIVFAGPDRKPTIDYVARANRYSRQGIV